MVLTTIMSNVHLCLFMFCGMFLNGMSIMTHNSTCTVSIDQGNLQGVSFVSLFANNFCAYLGVPYALPPVGKLRFKEPLPAERWSGVLNATQQKKICIGIPYSDVEMDEDCLYFDIYTPRIKEESETKYPVLVFIPGENYLGDNSFLYGPDYMMKNELVLVIINFRVGVLGFLSTGNSAALGNYGLKDQVHALKWIRSNIEDFGGDSDNVTIYGHGVGAACVHYHILSPMSKGLFHRAISQSGNALNPDMRPISDSGCLVKQLGWFKKCQNINDIELVGCLRELNATEFANITSINFAPAIEMIDSDVEGFLTQQPVDIIRSGNFNKVPWLMGNVNNEGASSAIALIQNISSIDAWNFNSDDILVTPNILRMLDDKKLLDKHWVMILDFYLGNRTHRISNKKIDALMQLYGDRLYYFGSYMSVLLHYLAGHKQIFMYNFALNGTTHLTNFSKDEVSHVGTDHGDDLLHIFKLPMVKEFSPGQPEIQVTLTLTEILSDFVKSGDPASSLNVTWDTAGYMNSSEVHVRYMDMTSGDPKTTNGLNFTMKKDLFEDRMKLWLSLPLYENDVYYSLLNFAHHLHPVPLLATIALTVLIFGFY